MSGFRIGHGYDVHRLTAWRKLILGGVDVPFERGLLGHSDADVLTHAVWTPLLGAAGLGDIASYFPTATRPIGVFQPAAAGPGGPAAGGERLAGGKCRRHRGCPSPQAGLPHPLMRQNLARHMGVPAERVNVKATTEEGLGFTGRGDGMAAHAVALLETLER
jgi:2C-methyl-D-erythritol 2,4-cyclodiphosphate synthase